MGSTGDGPMSVAAGRSGGGEAAPASSPRVLDPGRLFRLLSRSGASGRSAERAATDEPSPPQPSTPCGPDASLSVSCRRAAIFFAAAALGLAVVVTRLVHLQVVESDRFKRLSDLQLRGTVTRERPRLKILLAGGELAAQTVLCESVFVEPPRVGDPWSAAVQIGVALRRPADEILPLLDARVPGAPDRVCLFRWIERFVTPEKAARVRAFSIPGVGFREEPIRRYPLGPLGAQVIGGVGFDGQGLGGVEVAKDSILRGSRESEKVLRDARRQPIALSAELPRLLGEGDALSLTIDGGIQQIVEEELDRLGEEHRPSWTCAVAINPFTGDVLAMANRPTFDPNAFARAPADAQRNRCVTDPIEPGSTLKPFILAALLEEELVRLDDPVDCENGAWTVGGRRLVDHHPYGRLTVSEVVSKSSNIGAVKLGLLLEEKRGAQGVRRYLRGFGFGEATALNFPGESAGRIPSGERWSRYTATSVPIGYEIAVTPVQLACAYAAFANGGYRVEPRLVRGVVDADGRLMESPPPASPRRVLRTETVAGVRRALRAAVETGTAKLAQVPGYPVAGKTGTAQRYNPRTRRYDGGYTALFAAFAPADEARLCVLVVAGDPKGGEYYGGKVAAPAVGRILQRSLQRMEVPPRAGPAVAAGR